MPGLEPDLSCGSVCQTLTALSRPEIDQDAAELQQGSVELRRFRTEDAPALYEAVRESINEICSWMVWCRPDYCYEDCVRFIASCDLDWAQGRRHSFVILDQKEGTLLGSVGFSGIDAAHKVAGLGYWVRTQATGRRIASTAARLAVRFAFERLNLQRVEIVVPTDNLASLRVAESTGAAFEGVMKNRIMLGGKSHHAALYALVKSVER